MTTVWRTRGTVYHSRPDCGGIADGQAKAESEGKRTYAPTPIELSVAHSDHVALRPCMRCWPEEAEWPRWLPVRLHTELHSGAKDGSPFELRFLENVLMRVDGLDPGWVEVQRSIDRPIGAPLRADFVLQPPGVRPIVLEVDGFQKSSVPTREDQAARNRRDGELSELGYTVQHFTNDQVIHDAEWCRRRVLSLLLDAQPSARQHGEQAIHQARQQAQDLPPSSAPPGRSRGGSVARLFVVGAAALVLVAAILAFKQGDANDSHDPLTPISGDCPSEAPVKGNVSDDGEKIFHAPGWEFYSRTGAEECFATESDAERAGYRASAWR